MTDYRDTVGKGSSGTGISQTGVNAGPTDGLLFIKEIRVPGTEIKSGNGLINIEVVVRNGASRITFDPDKCAHVGKAPGYDTLVHAVPDFTEGKTKRKCLEHSTVGPYDHTIEFQFKAPSVDGTKNVPIQFWIEGAKSGNLGETYTEHVTVSETGEADPPPGGGNGDDGANWTKWILDNPGKAAILGIGGAAAMKYGLGE